MLSSSQASSSRRVFELVPAIAPVTTLADSYWTHSTSSLFSTVQLSHIRSPYSIIGRIKLLYKQASVDLLILNLNDFNKLKRLEAFCRWKIYDYSMTYYSVKRNQGWYEYLLLLYHNLPLKAPGDLPFRSFLKCYRPGFGRVHCHQPLIRPLRNLI